MCIRDSYKTDKCIGCGMCERVCSGNAITRTVEKTEEGDKITLTFNLGSCTFCATCADFCSRKAIELSGDYHMVATKEEDLLVSGSFIKKPPAKKAAPAPAAAPAAAAEGQKVLSPMPGTILSVNVNVGSSVKAGDILLILEAMKMENEIVAPCDGTVRQLTVQKGSTVATDALLAVVG